MLLCYSIVSLPGSKTLRTLNINPRKSTGKGDGALDLFIRLNSLKSVFGYKTHCIFFLISKQFIITINKILVREFLKI